MKKILLLAACLMCGLFSFSQSDIEVQHDALEVRFIKGTKQYDLVSQQYLRSQSAWQGFLQVHGTWYVHFNEATGLPHRAYGAPISMVQDTPEAMALSFAQDHLAMYNLPLAELVPYIAQPKGKYQWANFSQMHEGHKVLGGKYTVKFS
ncbi:MAG: hypothetical protein ACKVOR_12635, partial [Flavobacteriales bacterium]